MGVTYLSDVLCQSCPNVEYVNVRNTACVRTLTNGASSLNGYTDSLQQLRHSLRFRYEALATFYKRKLT